MAEALPETNAWRRLEWHHAEVRDLHLRDAFESDPTRGERLTAEAAGLYFDFSKHLVTDDTLALLRRLAAERDLVGQVRAMFRGEHVNVSEDRPALHVVLRMPASRSLVVDGADVVKEAHEELDRFLSFAERVRSGEHLGATGRPLRAVVNIGIGGSDLGPAMACEALRAYTAPDLRLRFVANVDPAALALATADLDPAETLVVVVSKTMTTLETAYEAIRRPLSIDHAVMEGAARNGQVLMAAMDVGWSDLGSWAALLAALGVEVEGGVVQPGETVEVSVDDLIVRRNGRRIGAIPPPEPGSMTARQPIAVLRGARRHAPTVDALLARCSERED